MISLTNQSITVHSLNEVGSSLTGGISIFLGTTRAERRSDGTNLLALDYDAYHEMAIEQMNKLASEASSRWPIESMTLMHRIGRVEVGQASVLICVACPHRNQSFEACRFLIDELKKSVAIWKKEVWADGTTSWKEGSLPEGAAEPRR